MLAQLEADFKNEQIHASQAQLDQALYLSELLMTLSVPVQNLDRPTCLTIANNTLADINRHHASDQLKPDSFWNHLSAYLESGVRVTQEFIDTVAGDLLSLNNAKQASPILCFLHNEVHFKRENTFYAIFRYLECVSRSKDGPKKYGRKLEAFNELIALFTTGTDDDIQLRCKTFVASYENGETLFMPRKGAFLDLLKSLSHQTQSIENIDTLKAELHDFCLHLTQQKAVVECVQKLTNIDSAMQKSSTIHLRLNQ